MDRPTGSRAARRRGATIVFVGVSTAMILAVAAIAVDLAMLFKMRSDAQRTADSAALAGASAYLTGDAIAVRQLAVDRALEYAARNYVGGTYVDTSDQQPTLVSGSNWTVVTNEATVEVAPGIYRVRVTIRRAAALTLFGRTLGVTSTPIAAYAAAEVVDAGSATCVMPFAIPDIWGEETQDPNGNRIQDGTEAWTFDQSQGDRYARYDPEVADPTQTGYGSAWRNGNGQGIINDYGRQIMLKPQSPQDVLGPSNFNLWSFIGDTVGAGRGGEGGIFDRVLECDPRGVALGVGDEYQVAPGNSVSLKAPIRELISRDPGAKWNDVIKAVDGSKYGDWTSSPRVVKIAMYDPTQIANLGDRQPITFNNIALFFLEGFIQGKGPSAQDNIAGRFLYYATGGSGETTGPLVKTLKLVE